MRGRRAWRPRDSRRRVWRSRTSPNAPPPAYRSAPSTPTAPPSPASTADTACPTRCATKPSAPSAAAYDASAARHQARALSTTEIRQIVTAIDRDTPNGGRDAAIILLGYASALRRSELEALTLADIDAQPSRLVVFGRRSKTDPEATGKSVGVAYGHHADTDPVAAALHAGTTVRGTQPGAHPSPACAPARPPSTGSTVTPSRSCSQTEPALLASPPNASPHSLRAEHATEAALNGVPIDHMAARTRHRRLSTLLERYIGPAQTLQLTTSRDLGL